MSAEYRLKIIGENMAPWGTPADIWVKDEISDP